LFLLFLSYGFMANLYHGFSDVFCVFYGFRDMVFMVFKAKMVNFDLVWILVVNRTKAFYKVFILYFNIIKKQTIKLFVF